MLVRYALVRAGVCISYWSNLVYKREMTKTAVNALAAGQKLPLNWTMLPPWVFLYRSQTVSLVFLKMLHVFFWVNDSVNDSYLHWVLMLKHSYIAYAILNQFLRCTQISSESILVNALLWMNYRKFSLYN